MLKFSTELTNAEISQVTLLKSDSTTFHQREAILPAIFKTLETPTGNICSEISLQYSHRWVDWTARTSRLQACDDMERGTILQRFF